jgi:hypothetical protein
VDIQNVFDEHKANETNYKKNLRVYWKTYPKFWYDSPFVILEDSFDTSNFNQYDVGLSVEIQEVQSNAHAKLKGGNIIKEDMPRGIDSDLYRGASHKGSHNRTRNTTCVYPDIIN